MAKAPVALADMQVGRALDTSLDLNFPACLAADFPELPVARAAVERVLEVVQGQSYELLERHSPALEENDWSNYLRCSLARMVHAAGALRRAGVRTGRLLDYGAYFGNFAGMFADLGFEVEAVDFFRTYAGSLARPLSLMQDRGVTLRDFDDVGRDLASLAEGGYDVVLCAGVIEHMPHSPKGLLASLNRVLKPGGYLIVDTPNLGHLYKRQALARGETVWPPLDAQFHSPLPYEGHHREYLAPEVAWMLHEVGHRVLSIELYNYSCYEQPELSGRDVTNFWRMVADPTLREYITTLSRRGAQTTPAGPAPDWRTLLVESEPHWQRLRPADPAPPQTTDITTLEPLLVQLQQEVVNRDQLLATLQAERTEAVESRDRMLAEQHAERTQAVGTRDRMLADMDAQIKVLASGVSSRDRSIAQLNERIGELKRTLDAKLSEVVKRQYRRIMKKT